MRILRRFFARYADYHQHGPLMLRYMSLLGFLGFPAFYFLRFTKAVPVYDDLHLRAINAALCFVLFLRDRWPERLKPYYLPYSYAVLVITLPMTFVFTSLKHGGGPVAVGNTLIAAFLVILLADWRNMVVIMATGIALATALYIGTDANPALPAEYVARLPMLLLVVVAGSLFKFALERATAEKVRSAYASIAGSIAHEMRNPLAQIKHSLESMQKVLPAPGLSGHRAAVGSAEIDALYRHLARGEQAIQRGLQVISMTLDEVNAKPLDTSSFSYLSAAEVVQKAVDEYGYESDEGRAAVSVKVDEDFQFLGDETACLFVLFNLIKNALYYLRLHPGTHVAITVRRNEICVRDTGPGIAPEVLTTLFEPFRSVGKSGGTGLGLAYCRRVMKAFGGDIRCRSVAGSFTEFTLRFPEAGEQAREQHRDKALVAARAALSGKRLLIVEDDAAQRVTTRHKLRPLGMVVDEASDGRRALDMLSRHAYDIVLLDLNMPLVDGYQVAQKVREGQACANRYVRIVAHTSEPPHLARVKTQRAGMDGFVPKPCGQLQLVQALLKAFERPPSAPGARPLADRRVLLADDSAYNRRAVAAYLREAGASVVEVDHGEAVLQALRAGPGFHVVLMDLNMPGLGGLDTSRAIRASHEGWSGIPIIALTAHSDAPAVQRARDAGMNGFLVKPVEAAQLHAAVLELTQEGAGTRAIEAMVAAPAATDDEGPLLNVARLESYQRLGLLGELMDDYLPEIARLVDVLQDAMAAQDLARAQETLHSLLGMSGEAGALALYQLVRGVYVPVLEQGRWPEAQEWVPRLRLLAARTEQALREYGSRHTIPE